MLNVTSPVESVMVTFTDGDVAPVSGEYSKSKWISSAPPTSVCLLGLAVSGAISTGTFAERSCSGLPPSQGAYQPGYWGQ
jgi:hypothetical protein